MSKHSEAYYLVKKQLDHILVEPIHFSVHGDSQHVPVITPEFLKNIRITTMRGSLDMSYANNCGITEDEFDELAAWIPKAVDNV